MVWICGHGVDYRHDPQNGRVKYGFLGFVDYVDY